jgi:hypothetical protein
LGIRGGDGRQKVRSECGNAALAWQVITDKGYLADFGIFFHEAFLALAQSASGRKLPYRRRFA